MNQIIPRGDLAESWEQPDDTTYTFKLRPDAKFHNIPPVNGRLLVAEDIIFSYNRQREEGINASYVSPIAGMVAVDDTTFQLSLDKPNGEFLGVLASGYNKIIAPEVIEEFGDLKEAPVIGTGAFLSDEIQDQEVTFKRNPDYFMPDLPYLDGLQRLLISDANTRQAAFRTGQDYVARSRRHRAADLPESKPRLPGLSDKLDHRLWDRDKPVVARVCRRPRAEGLAYAINRKQTIEAVWFGEGQLSSSISNIGVDNELSEAELDKVLPYDPSESMKLLSAAGAEGLDFDFTVWSASPESVAHGEFGRADVQGSWPQSDDPAQGLRRVDHADEEAERGSLCMKVHGRTSPR